MSNRIIKAIMSVIFFLGISFSGWTKEGQDKIRHVLLINSYDQTFSWVQEIVNAVNDTFSPDDNKIRLYIENMDTKRIQSKNYMSILYDTYKVKYKKVKLDLILSSDNNAFNFLRKNRDEIFPGVPVVFCGVNDFNISQLYGLKGFTGVAEKFNFDGTVELILKLHPKAKKIFIINDYLPTGKAWTRTIKRSLFKFKDRISFEFNENTSMGKLQEKLNSLSRDTIVLLGVYFSDRDRNYYSYKRVSQYIAGASIAPVYTLLDFYISSGIVGGRVISGYSQGYQMALKALRVLNGESVVNIPIEEGDITENIFDAVELSRLNIGSAQLPAGSKVINKSNLVLTREEVEFAHATDSIKVGVIPKYYPFEAKDSKGKTKGLNLDYMNLLSKKIGVKFEYIEYSNQKDIITALKEKKIDILASPINEKKDTSISYVNPYMSTTTVLIIRKGSRVKQNLGSGKELKLAFVPHYVTRATIGKILDKENYVTLNSSDQALQDVSFGKYDGVFINLTIATHALQKNELSNLSIVRGISTNSFISFSILSDSGLLKSIINKGIALISKNELEHIKRRWLNVHYKGWEITREFIIVFFIVVIVVFIGAIITWNRSLQRTVSERTRELSKLNKYQDIILSNCALGIIYVVNRRVVWANKKFTELSGIAEKEIYLMNTREFYISDEQYESVTKAYETDLREGKRFDTEVELKRRKGGQYSCELVGQAINSNCPEDGSIWILDDITNRKKIEKENQHLQQQVFHAGKMASLGTLGAGIAHELNNPLSVVNVQCKSIIKKLDKDSLNIDIELLKSKLLNILKHTSRMSAITSYIQEFSKDTNYNNKVRSNLNDIIIRSLTLLNRPLEVAMIDINLEMENDLVDIYVDRNQIESVFQSLIINSMESLESLDGSNKKKITIKTTNCAGYIKAVLEDTGIGIPEKIRDKIFDPFFTTKEVGKGAGLGLSVAYGVISAHDGTIDVGTPSEGNGAMFIIKFHTA